MTSISDKMTSKSKVEVKSKIKKRSQLKSMFFRFKKNKLAMFGLVILTLMFLIAVFANFIADYEADAISQNMQARLQTPNRDHILGTDHYGRDIFARVVFGARISLFVGVVSITLSLAVGVVIGSVAGYYGGKIDNVIMRLMDVLLAIPQTLMAISIVAALGAGIFNLLLAMSISSVPRFSRIVRSSILSISGQEFIEAAKACGTSDARIISKHIIPNAIGPIIVQATLNMASTIISIAGLSFIGLGIEPPIPEWGSMLSEGKAYMRYYPHLVIIPGIAIVFAVMGLNLIGDGLRDSLDPRLKN
ncbi:ABC transporter permease [Alkaliphilus peptidifermentans]|uniref:Peptide/nickel transport system permease protein n=1 Tax=Alkaliphilus peptidifermentans DSM 18978 TaxID=1120976 RepID=A0A1G5E3Q5_9FIRM|nr:ABC transporter permease [Alkaliphilus peptidifermentans]SCY21644.1 peptide/nickel transport system permease protein [Alkaliphilus peptidifermentans DSM 18978]